MKCPRCPKIMVAHEKYLCNSNGIRVIVFECFDCELRQTIELDGRQESLRQRWDRLNSSSTTVCSLTSEVS